MKRTFLASAIALLLITLLGVSLISCDPATPADTTAEAETAAPAATEVPAEVPTETPTEAPTEAVTEAVTETETLPETEAVPTVMTDLDVDRLAALKIGSYFSRASKCEVALADDETEGKVLRFSTKDITAVNSAKPTVYLDLEDMIEDAGGLMPDTRETPYLVLKVKVGDLWSRTFGIQAGQSIRTVNTSAALLSARLDNTAEWQYVYFDLTDFEKSLSVFYLCFEYGAGKNGEYLDVAEIRFVSTEEEAILLAGADVYPVVEQSAEDYTLKVMSFNVQTENGTQVDFALRAEMLRDLLDELQPDSIGMQEVTVRWIEWMDSFSFNDSYAGVGEGRTAGGEASSIYYRKDKYELVDSGTFWLSETPDKVGSSLPNANYPRICTWAHLRDKTTGFEYIHLNTHLDHNGNNSSSDGKSIRTRQVRVLLEYIQKLPDVPMVLTGDFNQAKTTSEGVNYAMFKNILGESTFTSSAGEELTGNFAEARAEAADTVSADAWASMTKYWDEGNSAYNPAKKPIDYVFYTADAFDAMVYRNIYYHRDGILMSDHLPQYCELHVKTAAAE